MWGMFQGLLQVHKRQFRAIGTLMLRRLKEKMWNLSALFCWEDVGREVGVVVGGFLGD
jgi:hypothetical protein